MPLDVYIALRADGAFGSGTEADAWNGGRRLEQPVISGATLSNSGATATVSLTSHSYQNGDTIAVSGANDPLFNGEHVIFGVSVGISFQYTMTGTPTSTGGTVTCQKVIAQPVLTGASISYSGLVASVTLANHPYVNGDAVTMSGVTGTSAALFNGEFPIYGVVSGVSFQYTLSGTPTTGAGGSITCQRDPYVFDTIMRALPTDRPVKVRVGPGVFQTRGYSSYRDTASWRPFSGMKIEGSGIAITTLKLVGCLGADVAWHAIGVPPMGHPFTPLDSFQASRMTVDCNIAETSSQLVTRGAIWIRGLHTRVQQIRAINFGRQGTLNSPECFVIAVCGSEIVQVGGVDQLQKQVDCVIEGCVVERPGLNSVKETTCITGIGGDAPLPYPSRGTIAAYHSALAVRNCFIDCDFQVNPVRILSITVPNGSGLSTVTTAAPHGLPLGISWARINGALVTGASKDGLDNGYNGSYLVTYLSASSFSYLPQTPQPTVVPSGESWVGRFPSQYVAITGAGISGSATPWTVTITTDTPHFLVPGNTVVVYLVDSNGSSGSFLGNGIHTVATVTDRKSFTFQMLTAPGTPPTTNLLRSFIGVTFQGVSIDAGDSAVMEGNLITNCRFGGPYHDTFSSKNLVVRNNVYRSVVVGTLQALGQSTEDYVSKFSYPAVVQGGSAYITHSGTTATFQTDTPTGLFVGWEVKIEEAKLGGVVVLPAAGTYNGYFKVESVNNLLSQFTYTMKNVPAANADGPAIPPVTTPTVSGNLLPHSTSLTHVGNLATFTVASTLPHGFTPGQGIVVSNALMNKLPAESDTYNGYYAIESVPTPTSFTYRMIGMPSADADATPGAKVNALHQVGQCVIENNLVELLPPTINDFEATVGIGFYAYPKLEFRPFPIFRRVVLRNNVIRLVEGRTEITPKALAAVLFWVENALVEDNVIDLAASSPLRHSHTVASSSIQYINNRDAGGKLIQGVYDPDQGPGVPLVPQSELTTTIEEAFILAMI